MIEHNHLRSIYLLKVVIFHGHVSLTERKMFYGIFTLYRVLESQNVKPSLELGLILVANFFEAAPAAYISYHANHGAGR